MAFPAPEFKDPISTPPKLSLFSLPTKLPDGPTPPPNAVAAVPFLWEEAPGKPRPTPTHDDSSKSKTVVRSLHLPPRLTNSGGIDVIPSPTTVLGGPYEGGVYTSPEKEVGSSSSGKSSKGKKMRMPLRNLMRKEKSPVKLSRSWRWDSFRDDGGGRGDRSPSVKFCSWRWDSFRDMGGGKSDGGGGSLSSSFDEFQKSVDSNRKIAKVARKKSFTFINRTTTASAFLAGMYGNFKQAMQRKSRR